MNHGPSDMDLVPSCTIWCQCLELSSNLVPTIQSRQLRQPSPCPNMDMLDGSQKNEIMDPYDFLSAAIWIYENQKKGGRSWR